jgi:hypothetical protein
MQDPEAHSIAFSVSMPKSAIRTFLSLSQPLDCKLVTTQQTALMNIKETPDGLGRHKRSFSPIEASVLFNAGLENLWEGIFPTFCSDSRSGSIGHWSQFMPASGHLLVPGPTVV